VAWGEVCGVNSIWISSKRSKEIVDDFRLREGMRRKKRKKDFNSDGEDIE